MKKNILVVLLVLVLALMPACGQSGAEPSAPAAEKPQDSAGQSAETPSTDSASGSGREIVIQAYPASAEAAEKNKTYVEDPLIAAFSGDNVRYEIYTDRQSIQVQVAGGTGPDIMNLDGPTDVAEFYKSGKIVELDGYAQQYGWQDLFYEWAWNTSYFDSKLISLPNSFEGMLMWYNDGVFEENGWSYPTNADELVDIMKKCQESGIIPITFGNANYQGAVDHLYSTFLSGYAGKDALKEALEGTRKWDDPLIKGGMELLINWWQAGYIGEKASQAISQDDQMVLFADGKAAMTITGSWSLGWMLSNAPETKWHVDLMPELRSGVGRVFPLATGGCYSINKNTKHPDFAAEIINWMFTNEDWHMTSVKEADVQPFPLKAIDGDSFQGMNQKTVDMYDILMQAQSDNAIGYCSWTFFPSDARVYMNDNTDGLFLGVVTLDDYLAEVQASVDNAIATGNAPPLP